MNNSVDKPKKSILKKVFNVLGVIVIAITVIGLVAHNMWKNSGTNEWVLASDKDGMKIYRLKTPGNVLYKYKVVFEVEARLNDVVSYIASTSTGEDVGAIDVRRIEEVNANPVFYAYDTYKLDMEAFGMVEVIIINQYSQDPETGIVDANVFSAHNREPRSEYRRMVHLSNNWTYKPLPNGRVEITSISEMDMGIPYPIANAALVNVFDEKFNEMKDLLLKNDKYKNNTVKYVKELDEIQNGIENEEFAQN
ncbi:hypothetical protein [Teredinibacter sp. KSP-S5-2]|uniref:hypothetical protein n=1 Tax=Teredinibacter sp. KSP-S5-2 TaxID=3034506 RepID=UPI002934807C|nr:hypothetical protein [Teredinibacter sp. KSP-S5-2]WNO11563.1 hypothetical protein P5V12_10305 [Teredinibacter sp. KSP-S5-2]